MAETARLSEDHRHQVHMVHLDAEPLHLDTGVVLVNRAHSLREAPFQGPIENPLPALRNPYGVVLVVVRAVGTQPDLPSVSIAQSIRLPAQGCSRCRRSGWRIRIQRCHRLDIQEEHNYPVVIYTLGPDLMCIPRDRFIYWVYPCLYAISKLYYPIFRLTPATTRIIIHAFPS